MDSIIAVGSNSDSQILWVFFTLFIGIALAIDFGIIGKFLHVFRIRNRNKINDNNTHNDSCQKTEISSILHVKPMLSQEEQRQQQQTFKRALVWTIIWISLAGVFAANNILDYGL